LLLTACVPVAMLRPPEPARGLEVSVGGSVLNNPFGEQNPVIALPYLAVAFGDGELEYNFSVQWGLRGGVKLGLGPGLALDAGLTVSPAFGEGADWSRGVPAVLDGGSSWAGRGSTFLPASTSSAFPVPVGGSATSFPSGLTAGTGWRRWGPWEGLAGASSLAFPPPGALEPLPEDL
jgi:hypothetical protein